MNTLAKIVLMMPHTPKTDWKFLKNEGDRLTDTQTKPIFNYEEDFSLLNKLKTHLHPLSVLRGSDNSPPAYQSNRLKKLSFLNGLTQGFSSHADLAAVILLRFSRIHDGRKSSFLCSQYMMEWIMVSRHKNFQYMLPESRDQMGVSRIKVCPELVDSPGGLIFY